MSKSVAVFLAIACVVAVPRAYAQVDKQVNEVSFAGTIAKPLMDGAPGVVFIAVHYGRLTWDALQIGVDVMMGGDTSFDNSLVFLSPSARWYFSPDDPSWTPYAGIGLGLAMMNGDLMKDVAIDPNVGIQVFISEEAAWFVQADYYAMTKYFDKGVLLSKIGLTVYW